MTEHYRRLDLCLQAGMEVVRYFERMEVETIVVSLISFLMMPFVMGSLWSVGMTLAWQLFMLGLKAGIFLFILCSLYMTYLRGKRVVIWRNRILAMLGLGGNMDMGSAEDYKNSKPKCTLLDTMLSVVFQAGLGFPAVVWDTMMDILPPASASDVEVSKAKVVKPKKKRLGPIMETMTSTQAVTYRLLEEAETDEIDTEGSQSQSEDADMEMPTARIVERMLLDATDFQEALSLSPTANATRTGRRRRSARTTAGGKPRKTKGAARL